LALHKSVIYLLTYLHTYPLTAPDPHGNATRKIAHLPQLPHPFLICQVREGNVELLCPLFDASGGKHEQEYNKNSTHYNT